jgi:putative CocE/NonD family hydrolase
VIRQPNPDDDFELREVMIPVRDGVELHTLIVSPRRAAEPLPILLLRTPYDAAKRLFAKQRTTLHSVLSARMAELRGYIFVFQDVRGRNGSGGVFELSRPPRGPLNVSATDETTDAWDTIDWLVNNVPGSNGRVAMYGTSYDGWTTLMALLDPHPALKAAVPVTPLVDGWMGDDWFHNGAFRAAYAFEYVHSLQSDAKSWTPFAFNHYDTYTWWLTAGSPADVGARYLDERHSFWKVLLENPAYSELWQNCAVDHLLRKSDARLIPTMHVHGWFDQEDIYGAPAAYAAMKARDRNGMIYFVAGPWFHGQNWLAGARLGELAWTEDAALRWREDQLAPFLAHYLKDAPPHGVSPVSAFNTGTRRWERLDAWPEPSGICSRALYLGPDDRVSWYAPASSSDAGRSYVSDPAKPVPHQPRPVRSIFTEEAAGNASWRAWLSADQRFVDGRPDVLTYVGALLEKPVTVRGTVTAKLFAQTTGTDADWIVKLIDVFPDLDAAEPGMSGYQLMISADILRGRYRDGFEEPQPIDADGVLEYTLRMPQVNHTFRADHRIMVQIQSTWFPLYDRNPQRFVPNIMHVKAHDYQPATHRIHASAQYPSRIELQLCIE